MKYIPDYRQFVNEAVNLKAAHLSSEDYQKAKKLKAFNSADWTWNPKSQLYDKVNESLVTEAKFFRLPNKLNAMWELKNSVDYIVGKHNNGDDYNPAEMKTIEEFIKKIKKSAKAFKDSEEVKGTIYESVVTEAKRAGLSKKETLKVAQKFADALTKLDGKKYTVSKDYEEDSFDLDIDGEEYEGGSYNINDDGSVVNMAVRHPKTRVSPTYGNIDDNVATIIKTIKGLGKMLGESRITEAAYANASRNELAQYIINLSNELKYAKANKDKKEIKYLKKDLAEVKAALSKIKNESVNESAMSELDLLAKEAKDFKAFTKEVFKEFKNLPKKADTLKWLEELYNDAINEAEKAEGDRSKLSAEIEKALKDKATESGVPIGLLRLVMRRGLDAWNSSHRAGVPQVAWGYARVNAFLEKGKGTWGKADADIAKEVRDEGKAGKLPIKNPSEFTKKEREA